MFHNRLTLLGFAVFAILTVVSDCGFCLVGFDPSGSGGSYPANANGREVASPVVYACPVNGEKIVVDGKLDDAVWNRAETARGFRVWSPNRGEITQQETVFKVAYDEDAIYFAVMCYEEDPDQITRLLSRRDNIEDSDVLGIYIDPYHDYATAFNFMTNAAGVQGDRYVYNDGDMDNNWDAVWTVETSITDEGWTAEFRIPFACVRYSLAETMTWGLNVYRYMHKRGEDTGWKVWDLETSGFVSRFGELRGLKGVLPRRQVEVTPYFVHRSTDPALNGTASEPDEISNFDNFGVDIKAAVTPNLTMRMTFQPDFGQVEADPSILNISPFETYYEEQRPFFTEGAQYFYHPDFVMFNSRRIGSGDPNSRIRAAGKLIGKTSTGWSIASLYAITDITGEGQGHNFFKSGDQTKHYGFARFSREFSDGAHRIGFAQSGVYTHDRKKEPDVEVRDGYTTGADFDLTFIDRDYRIHGSFIGSILDPAPSDHYDELGLYYTKERDNIYGTGGVLEFSKEGGLLTGSITGVWETDKLDLNDFGYLDASDEIKVNFDLEYNHRSEDLSRGLRQGSIELTGARSWLYAPGEGRDFNVSGLAWSYDAGHPIKMESELSLWGQWYSYWETWTGMGGHPDATSKYQTRTFVGRRGPLMDEPASIWGWFGFHTDPRYAGVFIFNTSRWSNTVGASGYKVEADGRWNLNSALRFHIETEYNEDFLTEQHLDSFRNSTGGIGRVSYVFGELLQRTVDVTIRCDLLFTRDLSLQFYAQPYLSVGDFENPKELIKPDSYDFEPAEDLLERYHKNVDMYDFRYTEMNLNMVLRWEFNPGSTFFLVWKQGRKSVGGPGQHDLNARHLFENEAENVFLAKVNYWLAF